MITPSPNGSARPTRDVRCHLRLLGPQVRSTTDELGRGTGQWRVGR